MTGRVIARRWEVGSSGFINTDNRGMSARTHPQRPSPEAADPCPLVHTFCRRALHQLSTSTQGPLSEMQLDRLRLPSNRRATTTPRLPKGLDPALLSSVRQALATSSSPVAHSSSTPAVVLQLFTQHLRYLVARGARISPSPSHARAFCLAILAQLSPASTHDDTHGGRPVRQAGRGGQQ